MRPTDSPAPRREAEDIVVFIVRRDTQCAECGEALGQGHWIRIEIERVLERWERPDT